MSKIAIALKKSIEYLGRAHGVNGDNFCKLNKISKNDKEGGTKGWDPVSLGLTVSPEATPTPLRRSPDTCLSSGQMSQNCLHPWLSTHTP